MDPSTFINSITGVVAIVMIFGIPIVVALVIMAVILSVSKKRHIERMKMIEQGLVPSEPKRRRGYALLGWGAVLLAFGLALVVAQVAGGDGDYTGGLIFTFIGAAMVIVWTIIRAGRKDAQPEQNNTLGTPPKG